MPNSEKKGLRLFKQALRYGSGRAFLILRAWPELPVDELLIAAAMRNNEYDPQCHGNQAEYIDELLKLRPNYGGLIREIARRFEFAEALDPHDAEQVYELLCWSEEADAEVVAIVHRHFIRSHRKEGGAGFEAIAQTEGVPGIIFLAQVVGATLLATPARIPAAYRAFAVIDEWLTRLASLLPEADGSANWREELAARAEHDVAIRSFLDAVAQEETKKFAPVACRPPCGMEELEGFLRRRSFTAWLRFQLSRAELAELRRRLVAETSPARLALICQVLSRVKGGVTASLLPRLCALARSRNRRLAVNAVGALALLKCEQVRNFAIREMANGSEAWKFVALLSDRWQNGDEKYVYPIFSKLRSSYARHHIIFSLCRNSALPIDFLIYLFRHCPCGGCRREIAKTILGRGAISQGLRREFQHDSNWEVCQLVYRCDKRSLA